MDVVFDYRNLAKNILLILWRETIMKKILALLLVAIMVIGMFAGCQEAGN